MDNKPKTHSRRRTSLKYCVTTQNIRKERAVNVTLTALFFMFLWNLDISVTSLINGMTMTNGFFNVNPMQMYHASMYGMVVIMVFGILYNWR